MSLSWAATGPAGLSMEGEFSPQAAKKREDNTIAVTMMARRFVLRNKGFLTSASPKKLFSNYTSIGVTRIPF